eukprot:352312-Chlamydomonas_euryale.AAC.4
MFSAHVFLSRLPLAQLPWLKQLHVFLAVAGLLENSDTGYSAFMPCPAVAEPRLVLQTLPACTVNLAA